MQNREHLVVMPLNQKMEDGSTEMKTQNYTSATNYTTGYLYSTTNLVTGKMHKNIQFQVIN